MQLDLVIRGQSNAAYFIELDRYAGANRLAQEVEQLLGFDGVADSVRIIYDRDGVGGDTVYPATAFLGDWMRADGAGGWMAGRLEQAFLDRMAEYRSQGMGDATAVVWLHSEYDSTNPNLSPTDWASAVRTDAALVERALGRDTPYLFVAAHPYGTGTDTGHQAIRTGMEQLAADPAFDGRIGARVPDLDVSLDNLDDNWDTYEYGFAHITQYDAQIIAARLARTAAEEWAAYAKPGSPVAAAGGDIASDGPRVIQAMPVGATTLQVDVLHDVATGFYPLNAAAASGLGWSLRLPGGGRVEATSAALLDADSLLVGFAGPVPQGAVLDYAWGIGRVAEPGGPGIGNAVMDSTWLPVWTPAIGVPVGVPANAPPAPPPAASPVAPPAAPPAPIGTTPPVPGNGSALDPELVLAGGLARLGFGRAGTEGEVRSLQQVLDAGVGLPDTARALADSAFFVERMATLTDASYVMQVYMDGLNRLPTAAETDGWVAAFESGVGRSALPVVLADTPEFGAAAMARAPGDLVW